jgi:hypothetical protein
MHVQNLDLKVPNVRELAGVSQPKPGDFGCTKFGLQGALKGPSLSPMQVFQTID